PPASPARDSFTDAQREEGARIYGTYCQICHMGPVNPDLRRSGMIASAQAFRSVVIDGALERNGMASFRAYISPAQAESVRAHISRMAEELRDSGKK
ncbi:MAG TPA: cytochrome c, partial [Novosphingobium sp.]|nr:cytochrome c [Novosphingobium sp.]